MVHQVAGSKKVMGLRDIFTRDRVLHEIDKHGHLAFLLNAFVGSYNRRTDVLERIHGDGNAAVLTAINDLKERMEKGFMSQETELQEAKAVLDTVSTGVTEIISRLNNLPTDNPAVQDEIDGIKAVGAKMAEDINAVLNSPPPPVEE